MNTLKLLELDKQLVLNIENLVNMAHNHSRSTDSIIDEIVETITKRDQALQLLQTDVSGSNLQKYLVRYTQLIEAPHALLDDEVVIRAKIIEVSNPTEINDLIKNIVEIKQIS